MLITEETFEAFLKCETKSHLYFQRAVGVQSEFGEWQRNLRQKFKERGWKRLRSTVREDQWCVGTPALQSLEDHRYRFIIDYTVALPEIHSRPHALELIRSASKTRDHLYIPLRFVPSEKLSIDDRLLLAFDAFALSQTCGKTPHVGRIIHASQYATVTVPLAGLLDKVRLVLGNMAAQQVSTTAPPLVLNKHCAECEFRSRCRQTAIEKDDLSLLPNIGEKERKKQNDKGFISRRENVDTSGAMGRLFLTLIGSIAELESDLIRERVLAGMRRAKLDGVRIGRAPMNLDRAAIVRDRLSGMTLTAVSKKWGISRSLVCKLVNRSRAGDESSVLPPPSVVDSL